MSDLMEKDRHVISMQGSSTETPWVECTCGWKAGPSTELMELGSAAFNHRDETGHGLRNSTFGMHD